VELRFAWTQLEGLAAPRFLSVLGPWGAPTSAAGTLGHVERLRLHLEATPDVGVRAYAVSLRHEVKIEHPDLGFALARAGLGIEGSRESAEQTWIVGVGVEVGIEAELRF
jgi:hypothetical protein